jgi:hypothetical protein
MDSRWVVLLFLLVLGGPPGWAQDSSATGPDTVQSWQEDAWTRIIERNGLEISYIFYSKANNLNDGVVLRLRNRNDYPVRYAFTIIFRGPEARATAPVEGILTPGEMRTGDESGLFWVPFENQRTIGELGLRDVRVTRASSSDVSGD